MKQQTYRGKERQGNKPGLRGREQLRRLLLLALFSLGLVACAPGTFGLVPTQVPEVQLVIQTSIPPTWTAAPAAVAELPAAGGGTPEAKILRAVTETPLPIPTSTPFTPPPTRTPYPSATPTPWSPEDTECAAEFERETALPLDAFPRPAGDNGWGIHWIPSVKQSSGVVDRFVDEVVRMHIKWVVILNDGIHVGTSDYLVDRLVANGIMPVMRLYRSDTSPYDGDAGAVVRHYLPRGVYYYQLYNEPNVNEENGQGFASPAHYAKVWAVAARQVVDAGGYPGLGALSPGGAYDHYAFLDRTFTALEYNGDDDLLDRTWLSVHNYHGVREHDDPDGFFLFRKYDAIVRAHLCRSMPMIGTEGGSYSTDPQVEKQFLIHQYSYMRDAEPYFFAFSTWLLANQDGGHSDPKWEYQALFRPNNWVHPVVTDFFYTHSR